MDNMVPDMVNGGMIAATAQLPPIALLKSIPRNVLMSGAGAYLQFKTKFHEAFKRAQSDGAKAGAQSADCGAPPGGS